MGVQGCCDCGGSGHGGARVEVEIWEGTREEMLLDIGGRRVDGARGKGIKSTSCCSSGGRGMEHGYEEEEGEEERKKRDLKSRRLHFMCFFKQCVLSLCYWVVLC